MQVGTWGAEGAGWMLTPCSLGDEEPGPVNEPKRAKPQCQMSLLSSGQISAAHLTKGRRAGDHEQNYAPRFRVSEEQESAGSSQNASMPHGGSARKRPGSILSLPHSYRKTLLVTRKEAWEFGTNMHTVPGLK